MVRPFVRAAALGLALSLTSCAALFPELPTKTVPAPQSAQPDAPPPPQLKWVRVLAAKVPAKTRDGRNWDQVFGSLPDPYVKIFVNDRELFRTNPQPDTLEPTWPDSPRGNFELGADDRVRVELWDSNPLSDTPIGTKLVGKLSGDGFGGRENRIELEGGAEVTLAVEPAHALYGFGFWYELRNNAAIVTRLYAYGPAKRAGMEPGDELLEIGAKKVSSMSSDEIRSAIGAAPSEGLPLVIRHPNANTAKIKLQEGFIYPTFQEHNPID